MKFEESINWIMEMSNTGDIWSGWIILGLDLIHHSHGTWGQLLDSMLVDITSLVRQSVYGLRCHVDGKIGQGNKKQGGGRKRKYIQLTIVR